MLLPNLCYAIKISWLKVFAWVLLCHHAICTEEKTVVIVGGGISGLATASHLCRNDICNVTILEAENRLGGRIYSDRLRGDLIERGAQFIHGENDNPVYDLLSEDHVLQEFGANLDEGTSFYSSGGGAIDLATMIRYYVASERVNQGLNGNLTNDNEAGQKDRNLEDEARELWGEEMQSTLIGLDRNMADAMIHFHLTTLSLFNAAPPKNVSVLGNFYFKQQGSDYTLVDEGYADALVTSLKNDIPDSAIMLQKRVDRILWNESQSTCSSDSCFNNTKVRIEFTDLQTGAGDELYADHVVVTVSIGVLQKYHESMFFPGLGENKSRALESQRIGIVNKAFLYYETNWWNSAMISILWNSDESAKFGDDADWYRHIFNIQGYTDNVLLVWLNSHASQAISRYTDAEVGQRLTTLLRHVLQDNSIPLPEDTVITRWHENDHFLGSYSYIPPGETVENKEVAASPLTVDEVPVVLFAGEGMHQNRFSTVDGAYRTGISEADRILASSARGAVMNPLLYANKLLAIIKLFFLATKTFP